MHFTANIYAVVLIDFLLSVSIAIIFRTGERKYLWRTVSDLAILRAVSALACTVAYFALTRHNVSAMRTAYFVTYYVFYLAYNAFCFKLYFEIYRRSTVAFTGFSRWAKPIFSWIVVVMVALTIMNIGSPNSGNDIYARAGINVIRAVETISLCVVALLCYLIRSMGLPWRSKVFGIMAGFMVTGLSGVIQTAQYQFNWESNAYLIALYQFSGIASLLIWIGYAFLPEPMPRPVTLPAESPVYRWSQIAASLGTKTQVAVPEPQHSFFLADVELIVDKVFARHMQESSDTNS